MPDKFDYTKFDLASSTALKFGYDVRFAKTHAEACRKCDLYCHCAVKNFNSRCLEVRDNAGWYFLRLEANKRENAAHELIDFFMSPDYDILLKMEAAHG